jgi:hypothetical protein
MAVQNGGEYFLPMQRVSSGWDMNRNTEIENRARGIFHREVFCIVAHILDRGET